MIGWQMARYCQRWTPGSALTWASLIEQPCSCQGQYCISPPDQPEAGICPLTDEERLGKKYLAQDCICAGSRPSCPLCRAPRHWEASSGQCCSLCLGLGTVSAGGSGGCLLLPTLAMLPALPRVGASALPWAQGSGGSGQVGTCWALHNAGILRAPATRAS